MLTFHRRRSGLRRDVMTAQMPASGLKQAGSMKVITNLSKCGLMTDSGLSGRNVINYAPTADVISRHTQSSILRNTYPELIL